jgi:hypothetical protein
MRKVDSMTEKLKVTQEMVEAGRERLLELTGEDLDYIVEAVYLAMEYQRLDTLGQLPRLSEHVT